MQFVDLLESHILFQMTLDILTETQHSEVDVIIPIDRIDNVSSIVVPFENSSPHLPDILTVSSQESMEMLNAMYDVYELHRSLSNKTVYVQHGFLDEDDINPACSLQYKRIHTVVQGIHERIKTIMPPPPDDIISDAYNINIDRLRVTLIEIINTWFVEVHEYTPIFKCYASILRKIFIDLWRESIREHEDFCIEEKRKSGLNVIRVKSNKTFNKMRNTQFVYISKGNIVKKVCLKYPPVHYLVDVKRNLCDCPDFVFRKWKAGRMCKHLKNLKNKTRCMMNLINIMGDRTHNILYPLKDMLTAAYDEHIQY